MNRRAFLRALCAAALLAVTPAPALSVTRRIVAQFSPLIIRLDPLDPMTLFVEAAYCTEGWTEGDAIVAPLGGEIGIASITLRYGERPSDNAGIPKLVVNEYSDGSRALECERQS